MRPPSASSPSDPSAAADAARLVPARAWPVLVALGLVVLLLAITLGVDLVVARRVAHETAEMVGNSQRGVELVDDLREQAHRLVDPSLEPDGMLVITRRIGEDARAYDSIATTRRERDEWDHLRGVLAALERAVSAKHSPATLAREAAASIDRLVTINREEAHQQAAAIRAVHTKAIIADASVGVLMLALVSAIAMVLLRLLGRQRALTARHIALLGERNRELDAFAERAAHDLRTPLNPIRGYADLLLAGDEPPAEVHVMAARIRSSVDRMARVIDDMLELSRAGRPTRGQASPARVGAEVLEELGAELRGASVSATLPEEPVACAEGVLAQILRNLVTNAVKFRSRHRPLSVRLDGRVLADAVELSISDNGVGMDAESAAHAFEPHFRGRADREVPGHGLGLAIVERATRALGGHCELTSAPDEGTRITLRLPRA